MDAATGAAAFLDVSLHNIYYATHFQARIHFVYYQSFIDFIGCGYPYCPLIGHLWIFYLKESEIGTAATAAGSFQDLNALRNIQAAV